MTYFAIMRLWSRLALIWLSLALLGGMLLHDAAGARMGFEMAQAEVARDMDAPCAACDVGGSDVLACDFDCTAPLLSTAAAPVLAAKPRAARPVLPRDGGWRGHDPGSDPNPPRSPFLS